MKIILSVIGTIASVGVLIVMFWSYQNKADIRFSLTEKPITINELSWQQIVVENVGKEEAIDILLKVHVNIAEGNYQLIKNSQSDNAEVNIAKQLEINYKKLPPKGKYTISFGSRMAINRQWITVSHTKGEGKPYGSNETLLSRVWKIACVLFLVLLMHSYFEINYEYKITSDTNAYLSITKPIEQILKKDKKPLLISKEKWFELREKAVSNIIAQLDSTNDIETSGIYLMLDSDATRKDFGDQWDNFRKKSSCKLKEDMTSRLSYCSESDLDRLIKLPKPKYMIEKDWEECQEKVRRESYCNLLEKIFNSEDPFNLLVDVDKKGFKDYQISTLNRYARFVAESALPNVVLNFEEADEKLKEKPNWMEDIKYYRYETTMKRLRELKLLEEKDKNLKIKSTQLLVQEKELQGKIEIVIWQLSVIDKILGKPEEINRIEDYENKFAPMNFENLKKVANLLQKTE